MDRGSWTRRWMRAYRPGQVNNCPYQYYPIGPDVGHLLGAGAAMQLGVGPQKAYQGAPVFGFTGDAGIAYSVMEFDTLTKYKIPAIMTVYNNNAWGMITAAARSAIASHVHVPGEPALRQDRRGARRPRRICHDAGTVQGGARPRVSGGVAARRSRR